MGFGEVDEVITDDVLPEEIDDLAVPVKLDKLLPWHRPRKQLVREDQWIFHSRRLIKKESNKHGLREPATSAREVRYLTLPGVDYLDVRQLADVCRDLDCSLTSTGFQSGSETNPYVARAQIREKALIDDGHITHRSHTFTRRFEEIVSPNSVAYRDLKSRAPFHIVNMDACGSIAAPTAGHANRLIDAMYRLVEMQLELMSGRWLLLVTTDVRPEAIARQTLDRLCEAIFTNADENESFRDRAERLLDEGRKDVRTAALAVSQRAGTSFLQLFALGLAKWFLHLVRVKNWEMETHVPYCYSTRRKGDDTPSMVCLAFEFVPPPAGLEDRYGVTHVGPAPSTGTEDTSILAIDKIADMANADAQILADASLRARVTENLRHWLDDAGYQPDVLAAVGV